MRFKISAGLGLLGLAFAAGCAGPLQTAIKNDDLPGIESALAAGADVNAWFSSPNINPLEYACDNQKFDALKLLIKKGADLSGRRSLFGSQLYLCISENRLDMVEYLVEHGAAITDKDLNHANSRPAIRPYLLAARRRRNDAILNAGKAELAAPAPEAPPSAPEAKPWWANTGSK